MREGAATCAFAGSDAAAAGAAATVGIEAVWVGELCPVPVVHGLFHQMRELVSVLGLHFGLHS